MARFNAETVDKYGSSGNSTDYFKLADDGDIATVRFLYDSADDITGYIVHEVEIDGKKKYINCLREYNQPVDDCPFCKNGYRQVAKMFIPLYVYDDYDKDDKGTVQIWERGKTFFAKISGICSRMKKTICSQTFEIERRGKKGSKDTQYEIFKTDDAPDDKTIEDFEIPNVVGRFILEKSADDMEFFIDNKYFPPEDEPVRRSSRSRDDDEEPRRETRRSSRRTPADSF